MKVTLEFTKEPYLSIQFCGPTLGTDWKARIEFAAPGNRAEAIFIEGASKDLRAAFLKAIEYIDKLEEHFGNMNSRALAQPLNEG